MSGILLRMSELRREATASSSVGGRGAVVRQSALGSLVKPQDSWLCHLTLRTVNEVLGSYILVVRLDSVD